MSNLYDRDKHLAYCEAQRDTQDDLITEWELRWPNYCRTCRGYGQTGYSINQAPLGSGYNWPENFTDPCHHCTERGICARCGQVGLTPDGEGPCIFCNWNYDDGRPADPECTCWREREKIECYVGDLIAQEKDWQQWQIDDAYSKGEYDDEN